MCLNIYLVRTYVRKYHIYVLNGSKKLQRQQRRRQCCLLLYRVYPTHSRLTGRYRRAPAPDYLVLCSCLYDSIPGVGDTYMDLSGRVARRGFGQFYFVCASARRSGVFSCFIMLNTSTHARARVISRRLMRTTKQTCTYVQVRARRAPSR